MFATLRTMRLGLVLTALLGVVRVGYADILYFTASIDGPQALMCTGTSTGTGSGTFTLDTVTRVVNYNITFSGLLGTETISHVHGPAAPCVETGVVYGLPLGSPKVGTATLANNTVVQNMIDGLHYVNIHSTVAGSGEIRGQILLNENPIPAVSDWGMIVMILLVLSAGTVVFLRRQAIVKG